ncbi:MAG: carbohydrate ABC transporter permease [Bacillaceae bacterium]
MNVVQASVVRQTVDNTELEPKNTNNNKKKQSIWKNPRKRNELVAAGVLLSPAILLILTFVIGPIIYAFFLSFRDFNMLKPQASEFVGIANYTNLFKDPLFLQSLWNTFKYSIIVVPVQTVIALLLAVAANQKLRGKTFFRVAYYIPAVTSAVASAAIFMVLFNKNGVANVLLEKIGFEPVSWFADPKFALPLAMIMAIWSTVGTQMLIFLAGLQDIPHSLYEAADVDGATKLQQLWHITVPMLRGKTIFVVITGLISTLQMFDQAYIISGGQGGPLGSTMTVVLFLYNKAFKENLMGYGAAAAFVLFFIIFTLTVLQKKFFKDEV